MANQDINRDHFPEQSEPRKLSGLNDGKGLGQEATDPGTNTSSTDNPGNRNENNNSDTRHTEGKEKYLRESANIEDIPGDEDREPVEDNSVRLTDTNGDKN